MLKYNIKVTKSRNTGIPGNIGTGEHRYRGEHSADPCCSGSDMSGYCRRTATTELLDCQLGKVLASYSSSFPPLFSHLCRPTTNWVAGMTGDLPTHCRHVHYLACSQASTFPSLIGLHRPYFHLIFGRPLILFPGISVQTTFLSIGYSYLLITWPYQFDILLVIFLEACDTLVVTSKCSFQILCVRVTPHIHLIALPSRLP